MEDKDIKTRILMKTKSISLASSDYETDDEYLVEDSMDEIREMLQAGYDWLTLQSEKEILIPVKEIKLIEKFEYAKVDDDFGKRKYVFDSEGFKNTLNNIREGLTYNQNER